MLLIFSTQSTTRLQYICKFIFEEVLGTAYSLTTHKESFKKHDGLKINYSNAIIENTFHLKPHNLLFEIAIKPQLIECINKRENTFFFKSEGADYPFDIFVLTEKELEVSLQQSFFLREIIEKGEILYG